MQKIHALLIALAIIVMGVIVVASLMIVGRNKNQDRFSVSESGSVYAKADIANINIGVKSGTKSTAAQATQESTVKTNKIIDVLKSLNVDQKDIKTSEYNLNPTYNWTQEKGQELTGYEVTQTLLVKIRDLNSIGDIISKTTELGANQIGNINFTIDDETALKDQAREIAIQKAKEKAIMIANQSGIKLGEIKNIAEESQPIVYSANAMAKDAGGLGGAESVPVPKVESGQNEVKVDVTLTYEVE